MTIAAAYLVSDGVVFGADSSTTVKINTPQGGGVVQLLQHAQKVFEVGDDSRFGLSTWGAGSIGPLSHRTIVSRLADKIDNNKASVAEAAQELTKIVHPEVIKYGVDFVGYYLGGWDEVNHLPACFIIEINKDKSEIKPLGLGQCIFSGNPIFFSRVFFGFDQQLRELLNKELQQALSGKINATEFDSLYNTAFQKVSAPLMTAGFQDLPIREAIDFVYSYLHITVKAEKFKFGPPTCGGPIEVGFVSTDRKFRWVKHKPFYSAIEEQEGGECDVF